MAKPLWSSHDRKPRGVSLPGAEWKFLAVSDYILPTADATQQKLARRDRDDATTSIHRHGPPFLTERPATHFGSLQRFVAGMRGDRVLGSNGSDSLPCAESPVQPVPR